jgi:hypothetical protein
MSEQLEGEPPCDKMVKRMLLEVKERVLHKDRDYVAVYDGEEGVGKSVLAMQHAKILDPNFNVNNVVFNSDEFIKKIKDPKTEKGSCIVLDEAFNAANSRSSLTQVNRSMIALATEMRQKNLFVLLVLPTFFDLDRYFAIWRCRALFHVYFAPNEDRRYIIFDKESKKLLYLLGKKFYSYGKPESPFPPSTFSNTYVIPEMAYRESKAQAFKKRVVSQQARNWLLQRNELIKQMITRLSMTQEDFNRIFTRVGIPGIDQTSISKILTEFKDENEMMQLEEPILAQ